MKLQNVVRRSFVAIVLLLAIFSFTDRSIAASKKGLCRPDICAPIKSVAKSARDLIPSGAQPITQDYKLRTETTVIDSLPSDNSTAVPLSQKFKANRSIRQLCRMFTGGTQMQCIDIVEFGACPEKVQLRDGGTTYSCDLTCTPSTPDSEGNCDCDVRYDTCSLL